MIERIQKIAAKCKTREQAMRLWDWIDCQSTPEVFWDAMRSTLPAGLWPECV